MTVRILQGDCCQRLRTLDANSVDAVVTDPPYHLTTGKKGGSGPASLNLESPAGRARVTTGFMGMAWDGGDVAMRADTWAEVLRVLKPGGHMLAFGGSRTYHRMASAIEDAGFEIRDQIMWLYGSGFPKSHNLEGDWDGWGTALKPAHEPIVVARKSLIGTVAENVEQHGTGAMNIAGCRVDGVVNSNPLVRNARGYRSDGLVQGTAHSDRHSTGRWPANVIHDGSEEVVAGFPKEAGAFAPVRGTEPSNAVANVYGARTRTATHHHGDAGSAARFFYCAKADRKERNIGLSGFKERPLNWSSGTQSPGTFQGEGTRRVAENDHPTVKPIDLMRYLCRLVTPGGHRA